MATQASRMTERSRDRLRTPHPDDELGRLARAFNGLLDRLIHALQAQRQFMADASHELRTPVSVVRTTAQVALAPQARTAEEYRELLEVVSEQGAHLTHLVDAMFLLSRAEANGLPLIPEPVYLDEIVEESARALRMLSHERQVTVTTGGDTELLIVGDDRLLRQMVTNVLDNAVRHARAGGSVSATTSRSSSDVAIRITDDGPGVPADARDRIFQRFARFSQAYAGAGLGLPIARWVAEAHGGTLVLESAGPGGTTFALTLPVPGLAAGGMASG
jgi:signal transduction histidine kinase